MKNKKLLPLFFYGIVSSFIGLNQLHAETRARAKNQTQDSIRLMISEINRFPDSLELHTAFLEKSDVESPKVAKQYKKWSSKFKKSAVVPYAFGSALMDKYDHHAERWLSEAVKRNPLYAPALYELSLYADFSGDKSKSNDYLRRAVEADPENPNYAFYYSSRDREDMKAYERSTFEFINKFPRHQRAAQALYWLAYRTDDQEKKIKLYEKTLAEYSPAEYSWSAAAMPEYFNLLLAIDPKRAVHLANRVKETASEQYSDFWVNNVEFSEKIVAIKALLKQQKGEEAKQLLATVKPQRGSATELVTLLSMEAISLGGNDQAAYDSLMNIASNTPLPIYMKRLALYGDRLRKSANTIEKDLRDVVHRNAVSATPFALEQYFEKGTLSLDDLKGKVVLLTYWYPGCGPCRAEFPHFENVLSKFDRANIVYLGINIVRKQDEFVLPFMEESKHTFIPLKEIDGRDKGNLDNKRAAPVNFLIDKDGKIAFSKFMINGSNEAMLEKMISLLL